jgi:hypothetical protein
VAERTKLLERLLHGARGDDGPLAGPVVEVDAHLGEGVALVGEGPVPAPQDRVDAVGHLGRPLLDISAPVAVLGDRLTPLGGEE